MEFDLGAAFGGLASSANSINWYPAIFLLSYVVILCGIMYFVYKYVWQYPYLIKIYSKRGNGTIVMTDYAKISNTAEGEWFWFIRRKQPQLKPQQQFINIHRGLFRKYLINFFEDNNGDLQPMAFTINSPPMLVINAQEQKMAYTMGLDLISRRYKVKQSLLQQWMPLILNITIVAIVFVIFLYMLTQLKGIQGGLEAVGQSITTAARAINGGVV